MIRGRTMRCSRVSLLFRCIVIMVLCASLTGCIDVWPFSSGELKVEEPITVIPKKAHCSKEVPYVRPASEEMMGPAALAMVMRYYGYDASPQEIAKEIKKDKEQKIMLSDLAGYARKRGFKTVPCCGTIMAIKESIANNVPVIVMVKDTLLPIFGKERFLVIYGYDDDKEVLYVHGEKPSMKISESKFLREWKARNFLFLIVTPQ